MESKIFTARIDDREMVENRGEADRQRLADQRWDHLNRQLCHYLAENLPTEHFQLFRVQRVSDRDPRQRCTVLSLILEVGQFTTISRVDMIEPGNDPFDDLRPTPLRPTQRDLQTISNLQALVMGSPSEFRHQEYHPNQVAFERAFASPENTPLSGRKVLVEKHAQPA